MVHLHQSGMCACVCACFWIYERAKHQSVSLFKSIWLMHFASFSSTNVSLWAGPENLYHDTAPNHRCCMPWVQSAVAPGIEGQGRQMRIDDGYVNDDAGGVRWWWWCWWWRCVMLVIIESFRGMISTALSRSHCRFSSSGQTLLFWVVIVINPLNISLNELKRTSDIDTLSLYPE